MVHARDTKSEARAETDASLETERANALPHVFERFWQFDGDSTRGLGLGLFICKKIVEGHGGQIRAESGLGTGATFRFTLPAS